MKNSSNSLHKPTSAVHYRRSHTATNIPINQMGLGMGKRKGEVAQIRQTPITCWESQQLGPLKARKMGRNDNSDAKAVLHGKFGPYGINGIDLSGIAVNPAGDLS
ncbi:hypothetical protein Ddc_08905 [Ditylenchus destructor]|nr:hypothetical protein Ddc_08905 [Ditylenchus destructor]